MAVITQFIVVRDGVEKMTFATKKEADAYDKQLDIAENLAAFIEDAGIELGDQLCETLTLHFAKEATQVASILKGGKPKATKSEATKSEAAKPETAISDADAAEAESKSSEKPAKVKLVS
jgi:uncharacterized protein